MSAPNNCRGGQMNVRWDLSYTRKRESVTMRTLKSRDSYVMRCRANRVTKSSRTFKEINLILLKFHMCFLFVYAAIVKCVTFHNIVNFPTDFCETFFFYYRSINFHHPHCRVVFIAQSDTRMGNSEEVYEFRPHTSQWSETYFNRELRRIQWKNEK